MFLIELAQIDHVFFTGLTIDGAEGTEDKATFGTDIDYQLELSTVTVQFKDFSSLLHGVMGYQLAIGTTEGGEDIYPYSEQGIVHHEESSVDGEGKFQNIMEIKRVGLEFRLWSF